MPNMYVFIIITTVDATAVTGMDPCIRKCNSSCGTQG